MASLTPPEPPAGWATDAACSQVGPERFFATEGQFYAELPWASSCGGCPVRAHCLAHALLNGEHWGVWGGLTPGARFRLGVLLADGAVTWEQILVTFHGRPAEDSG